MGSRWPWTGALTEMEGYKVVGESAENQVAEELGILNSLISSLCE